jgi:DNA-binding MarR family transcriptional regulator
MSNDTAVPYETTLHIRDHCLCFAAQRAARALARRFDAALRPVGITSWQFSLLMSLNRPQPPPMAAVAAVLGMDRTTLTANLKPLERRGLVRATVDPEDRRGKRLALTGAGRKLLGAALPIWQRTHDEVDDLLGARQASDVRAALCALAEPRGRSG